MGRASESFRHSDNETIMARFESSQPVVSRDDNSNLIASRAGNENELLLGGIPQGFVNRSADFIDFISKPDAVSNTLIGIGPVLDNAVNYYGNHILNSTTAEIGKDLVSAWETIKRETMEACQLPAEKRGELIGGIWVDLFLAEASGLIVKDAIKANALTEEAVEHSIPSFRKYAGAGGDWKVINERFASDVVMQTNADSCVAASGEMLSNGRLSQKELFAALKLEYDPRPGRNILLLADHLGPEWQSGRYGNEALDVILRRGSFAAELKDWTIPGKPGINDLGHTVVVDGLDDAGLIRVRDPQHGTRYEMMREEFLRAWTGGAVWRRNR
jgi:hypothetical protein